MMKSVSFNKFSDIKNLTIDSDSRINLLLEGDTCSDIHLDFEVKEGVRFELVIVDFENTERNVKIKTFLNEGSLYEVSLACINSSKVSKIYSLDSNHEQSNSYSRTKMAGINAADGVLRFLGSSYIRNGAHACDTRQEGKITNLCEGAKSEVSPTLLIKDNDVKASHGAALGAYDEDELFYLMSRGLSMDESKKLITYGTLLPIIELLEDEKAIEKTKEFLGGLAL